MRQHWTSLPSLMGVGVEKGVLGGAGLPRPSVRVGPGGARGGAGRRRLGCRTAGTWSPGGGLRSGKVPWREWGL